jgi:chorismate lyase/3-hydroxybenzoate synthase
LKAALRRKISAELMHNPFRPAPRSTPRSSPLSVAYVDETQYESALTDERVFAVIGFAGQPLPTMRDPRFFTVGLPAAGVSHPLEVWRSSAIPQVREAEGIFLASTDEFLFARLEVDETRYADLDAATYAAYRDIRATVEQHGYPYLFRVWNYFPGINQSQHGAERYRAFCQGRYRALANTSPDFEITLPSACAIGSRQPGLLIYLLAAKHPGVQIENPRQVSAFRYPPQYGPKSPSFSRAVLKQWEGESHLYVSGTASIVGHMSQHPGDPLAQLDETLVNLEALLTHAGRYLDAPVRLALLKVYARPELDIAAVQQRLGERLGADLPQVVLLGDICRQDLLLEVEGLGISV